MNILVFTRSAWDDTNSIGNTMSNLFNGYNKKKIANIYLRSASPQNEVCDKYFSISDFDVIKGIVNRKHKAGRYYDYNKAEKPGSIDNKEESTYKYFRNKKSLLAYEIQEFVWGLGSWKNSNLDSRSLK